MANCHEMHIGEVYTCEGCGIELKVLKECKDVGKPAGDCDCHDETEPCVIACCGAPLTKKS
jgi:hypothetical protein